MALWHLWIGRARHPGPGSAPFLTEALNVGRWLTHGDFALGAEVDFFWRWLSIDRFLPGFVVNGLGCGVRGWPPSGRLLRRRRRM